MFADVLWQHRKCHLTISSHLPRSDRKWHFFKSQLVWLSSKPNLVFWQSKLVTPTQSRTKPCQTSQTKRSFHLLVSLAASAHLSSRAMLVTAGTFHFQTASSHPRAATAMPAQAISPETTYFHPSLWAGSGEASAALCSASPEQCDCLQSSALGEMSREQFVLSSHLLQNPHFSQGFKFKL